jgi:4-hydroxybutyryl-CoA dehydratase/vinylacetyl-CoA-Delta-isomerase
MEKISDRKSYLKSISNRNLKIFLMGELVDEPYEHPIIKPSIEAMAETYELAVREPELATTISPYTGEKNK